MFIVLIFVIIYFVIANVCYDDVLEYTRKDTNSYTGKYSKSEEDEDTWHY